MPSPSAVEVRDDDGERVPLPGVRRFEWPEPPAPARATLRRSPPPDSSGVVPGDSMIWYQWADDPRGGRRHEPRRTRALPRSTDLLATSRERPNVRLCFTFDPPQLKDAEDHPVRVWISAPRGRDAGIENSPMANPSAFRRLPDLIPGLPRFGTDLPAPPGVARLARPGAHRAGEWQQAWGGRRWGGIVVSARGYPEIRVLQVAAHERWLGEDEVARVLLGALRRRHFWPHFTMSGRPALTDIQRDAIVHVAATTLLEQARHGGHTPAYPLWSSYLRLLTKPAFLEALAEVPPSQQGIDFEPDQPEDHSEGIGKQLALADAQLHGGATADPFTTAAELDIGAFRVRRVAAALAGGWRAWDGLLDADRRAYEHEALRRLRPRSEWSPRTVREIALELAQTDGYDSLSLLLPQEREEYEDRAADEFARRNRLREMRTVIRVALDGAGVTRSRRAVEQFVARHANDTEDRLRIAARIYLERRGALPEPASGRRGTTLADPSSGLTHHAPGDGGRRAGEGRSPGDRAPHSGPL